MYERISFVAALSAIADLLCKRAVIASVPPGERRSLLDGLVWLVDARNPRGAMDVFGAPPLVMIALALLTLAAFAWWLRKLLPCAPMAQVGYGLVAGGAVGNVIDRIVHGYVVDFIEPRHWYAFNVADATIAVGLILIGIALGRAPVRHA